MSTHRIRLRGAWEVTPLAGGRARHLRRFGRPRTLDPGETVWVVCEAAPGPAAVLVNGEVVGRGEAGPFAVEITTRLAPRNELVIETADGPLGEVALEVRS
jgi:hypothetical protein